MSHDPLCPITKGATCDLPDDCKIDGECDLIAFLAAVAAARGEA